MDPFHALSSPELSSTERTKLRRHSERAATDRSALHDILDAAVVCHLGVVVDGAPLVLPTGYGRIGETLYLHGSSANRSLAAGYSAQVCVTVTLLDGLVCARSVFNNSMNYRCAVIFGTAREVTGEAERLAALEAITEHLIPGRWASSRQPTRKELAATSVLALPLDEASVKIRAGGPKDDDDDYALDAWAGVLPITMVVGQPEPDPLLRAGIGIPQHIADLQTKA